MSVSRRPGLVPAVPAPGRFRSEGVALSTVYAPAREIQLEPDAGAALAADTPAARQHVEQPQERRVMNPADVMLDRTPCVADASQRASKLRAADAYVLRMPRAARELVAEPLRE